MSWRRWPDRLWRKLAPEGSDPWLIAGLALVLIAAAWIFLDIAEDVMEGDPLVVLDMTVYTALQAGRTSWLDTVLIAVTECGDTAVVGWVTFCVVLGLAQQRAWRSAGYWLAAVGVGSVLNTVIKVTLHRARPAELYAPGWSAFSFPSGHSTVNLVLWGFLAVMLYRGLKPAGRIVLIAAAAVWVAAIAFSRLYLGAHWLSDVGGGLAFGGAWVAGLGLLYQRGRHDITKNGRVLWIAVLALVVGGAVEIAWHHKTDTERYMNRVVETKSS